MSTRSTFLAITMEASHSTAALAQHIREFLQSLSNGPL